MIQLTPSHWKIVKDILSQYPYQFYAFGSRVKQKSRPLSDLDLCYKTDIPDAILTEINGQFSDSNLPFSVELVNWNHCTTEFQTLISKDLVEIK